MALEFFNESTSETLQYLSLPLEVLGIGLATMEIWAPRKLERLEWILDGFAGDGVEISDVLDYVLVKLQFVLRFLSPALDVIVVGLAIVGFVLFVNLPMILFESNPILAVSIFLMMIILGSLGWELAVPMAIAYALYWLIQKLFKSIKLIGILISKLFHVTGSGMAVKGIGILLAGTGLVMDLYQVIEMSSS